MNTLVVRIKRRLIAVLAISLALQGVVFVPAQPAMAAEQNASRWRNDDGTEVTATYSEAQDTPRQRVPKGVGQRVRFGVAEDGSESELQRVASTVLDPDEVIGCGIIDPMNGYAYFGIESSPAAIVKVALGSGSNAPTRIGSVTLDSDDSYLNSCVIDTASGYGYFISNDSPSQVLKIALGSGNALPSKVGETTLATSEEYAFHATVIDTANGYLYIATGTIPSVVVKVAMGAGSNPPTRVGAVTLNSGEGYVYSATIDTVNGYAYFGTYTEPGVIVKVALGAGVNPPTRVNAVTLDTGDDYVVAADIDVANGYAYFGTDTTPGRIIKVALGVGPAAPTKVAALTLNSGEDWAENLVIDATNGYAYVPVWTAPARVVKVALGAGPAAPTRIGSVTMNVGENYPKWYGVSVIDLVHGHLFVPMDASPGVVVKLSLGSGLALPTRLGSVTLQGTSSNLRDMVIDSANGYAYFGTSTIPGRIIKVRLGEGSSAPVVVATLTLPAGEDYVRGAVIDPTNGHAYFVTNTNPGKVVKIALGAGDSAPTRLGSAAFGAGESFPYTASVIDTANGYAYFGTYTSPGRVVKFALGSGANPPSRIGAVTLNSGENNLYGHAVIDIANGYAYFGTDTSPGRVVKVALGAGANPPTRIGAVTLNSGEDRATGAVIDTMNGYAYFGTFTAPSIIVKVGLGSGANPPTRVGAVALNSGEDAAFSGIVDVGRGVAFFGMLNGDGGIVEVSLGSGANPPTRVAGLALSGNDRFVIASVYDEVNGYAYFGTAWNSTSIVKIAVSHHFRLEYGTKSTSCAAVTSWERVAESPVAQHWAMSSSANVVDGAATTDSAGVANGGSSFVPGSIHDETSETAPIHLATSEFTEIEYSVEATASAVDGDEYCFRLTNAGMEAGFTFTAYAEAEIATLEPTLQNTVTFSRLQAGESGVIDFSFVLQNDVTGTLTVTFPVGFTVTSAATAGGCVGGTVDTFGFTASTLTAEKHDCLPGTLFLTGAMVTNPGSAGAYIITWINDDPGEAIIYIIDDDQITVTGNVDPYLTFNAGAQDDATTCDGTFSGNGGTLALGVLTTGAVTTSDTAGIDHICTRTSTNASGGALITVKNANGASGLVSTSVPADTIPSSTATLTAGTAGYGLCAGSDGGDFGNDAISGAAAPAAQGDFASTCGTADHEVAGLNGNIQTVWGLASPSVNAYYRLYVKAAVSPVTPAHADYTDTLTFIGTGTF